MLLLEVDQLKITYSFVKEILKEINNIEPIEYEINTLEDFDIRPCCGCETCFIKEAAYNKMILENLKEKY